jgi:hypothetical protein
LRAAGRGGAHVGLDVADDLAGALGPAAVAERVVVDDVDAIEVVEVAEVERPPLGRMKTP